MAARAVVAGFWAVGLPDACRGERGGRQSVGAGQPPTLWLQCGGRDHRDGMSCIDDRAGTPAALAGVAIDDDGLEQVPGAEGARERLHMLVDRLVRQWAQDLAGREEERRSV